MSAFRVAMIGLDTSHSVEFARRIQGDAPELVAGLRVSSCLRFPSPFQSEDQQDQRQAILEGWDIPVVRELDQALEGVDGIMLEINDPAQHLPWFERIVDRGLPVFVDKPLAADLDTGRRLVALAREHAVPTWESSSLRFGQRLAAARDAAGTPELCTIHGILGQAAAGSSLVWYGCHTFQMLQEVMGPGAESVHAVRTARGVVSVVQYPDQRQGIVESVAGSRGYGGRVQGERDVVAFESEGGLYDRVLHAVRDFFVDGRIPVPLDHSLEAMAMIVAAEDSLDSGGPVPVASVTAAPQGA